MKRIKHLSHGFRNVLLNRDSDTERARFRGGVENDRHQIGLACAFCKRVIDLTHHRDVQNIQRRADQRDARHAFDQSQADALI